MWPNSPETQELLQQAQQGEAGAVDKLLATHREPLRRMVKMRLDPAIQARVDASDIAQDVLLEASRRLGDYLQAPKMPFHLWLRHIARDHVIDAYRRHRQARRRSVERERSLAEPGAEGSSAEMIQQLIDRELTPATAALRQEMRARFEQALATLSDDDREVLLMRHFEQLSNGDVAVALHLTEAAASMRYLRALRRLRTLLSSPGSNPSCR